MKKLDDDARLLKALKALADPTRFRMTRALLRTGEMTCGKVGELFALSQPAMSHHLKILLDAGIVEARPAGRHHFISVNRTILQELLVLLPARLAPFETRRKRG